MKAARLPSWVLIALILAAIAIALFLLGRDPAPIELKLIARNLSRPLGIVDANDGSGRLFIVGKLGEIAIYQGGEVLPTAFLDLRDQVQTRAERGLLGLAFDPDYAHNRYFYIHYTDRDDMTVIARYQTSDDPNRADPDSETILIRVEHATGNHHAGQLAFGPDGYLYIALGDGGSPSSRANGQDRSTLLAKLLRIDVRNADQDDGLPYDIPTDNPFYGEEGLAWEVWAYGLRNPWRFSFDRATGDLYLADPGQDLYEEIDYQRADALGGRNYGWAIMEGRHCFPDGEVCDTAGQTVPVIEYPHEGGNLAVIGGYVYRGEAIPELQGLYLYGDFGSGRLWATSEERGWQSTELLDTDLRLTSFGEDQAGELYVVDIRGKAYRVVRANPIRRWLWRLRKYSLCLW